MKIPVRLTSDLNPAIAYEMVKSVRRHMPDAELIHVLEEGGEMLDCFDSFMWVSPNGDFVEQLLRVMAQLDGDVISLDYDIIVQDNLSHVFAHDFDVAFTKRPSEDKTVNKSMYDSYNMGVIFSKSRDFWQKALELYLIQEQRDGWLKSQSLVGLIAQYLAKRHGVKLLELPGETYNYSPLTRDEDVSGRKIVHYKGRRKSWMLPEGMEHETAGNIKKTVDLVKRKVAQAAPVAGVRADMNGE